MEKPMSMIERCAKAIYEKRNGGGCTPWSRQKKVHQAPYLDDARAAIEAMREPTHFMVEAGGEANYGWTREESIDRGRESSFDEHASNAKVLYQAVVDAAIKEQEREG